MKILAKCYLQVSHIAIRSNHGLVRRKPAFLSFSIKPLHTLKCEAYNFYLQQEHSSSSNSSAPTPFSSWDPTAIQSFEDCIFFEQNIHELLMSAKFSFSAATTLFFYTDSLVINLFKPSCAIVSDGCNWIPHFLLLNFQAKALFLHHQVKPKDLLFFWLFSLFLEDILFIFTQILLTVSIIIWKFLPLIDIGKC